mmetsp:Transcript_10611/g.26773  ORF Transcript_10611/g.26773 Transcript_10611/m.26773 type:complete len:204 (+) Transcript_10611:2537-3148(+)
MVILGSAGFRGRCLMYGRTGSGSSASKSSSAVRAAVLDVNEVAGRTGLMTSRVGRAPIGGGAPRLRSSAPMPISREGKPPGVGRPGRVGRPTPETGADIPRSGRPGKPPGAGRPGRAAGEVVLAAAGTEAVLLLATMAGLARATIGLDRATGLAVATGELPPRGGRPDGASRPGSGAGAARPGNPGSGAGAPIAGRSGRDAAG